MADQASMLAWTEAPGATSSTTTWQHCLVDCDDRAPRPQAHLQSQARDLFQVGPISCQACVRASIRAVVISSPTIPSIGRTFGGSPLHVAMQGLSSGSSANANTVHWCIDVSATSTIGTMLHTPPNERTNEPIE